MGKRGPRKTQFLSKAKIISEAYGRGFDLPPDASIQMRNLINENVPIGVFKQGKDEVLLWIYRQTDEIKNELLLRGLIHAVANARAWKKYGPNGYIKRRINENKKYHSRAEKARQFDRIVEMLDHEQVGDKLLGDCTKADLLRAAVAAEQDAGRMTLQAGFYRLLADLMEHGQTVRQSNKRGEIVALLKHTFQEAA